MGALWEHAWIVASLVAAFFQAIRYAALKSLNAGLSTSVTTYVRVLFALPWLAIYLAAVLWWTGEPLPDVDLRFAGFATLAALGQFLGTALVVRLFQIGNFAAATLIIKADVLMTAMIGTAFFSERITPIGWVAIVVCMSGVMIMSAARAPGSGTGAKGARIRALLLGGAVRVGLASALLYALSYLSLREAILVLPQASGLLVRTALAAFAITLISVILIGGWLLMRERRELWRIGEFPGLAMLVGSASAVGTIAWFIASGLTNASYVAAVSQVQIAFTLLISTLYFKERILPAEMFGMGVLLAGLIAFRLA